MLDACVGCVGLGPHGPITLCELASATGVRRQTLPEPTTMAVWSVIGLCWSGVSCWRKRRSLIQSGAVWERMQTRRRTSARLGPMMSGRGFWKSSREVPHAKPFPLRVFKGEKFFPNARERCICTASQAIREGLEIPPGEGYGEGIFAAQCIPSLRGLSRPSPPAPLPKGEGIFRTTSQSFFGSERLPDSESSAKRMLSSQSK